MATRYLPLRRVAKLLLRRSEEHTSELQSQSNLVCRLLLEKKKKYRNRNRARKQLIDRTPCLVYNCLGVPDCHCRCHQSCHLSSLLPLPSHTLSTNAPLL